MHQKGTDTCMHAHSGKKNKQTGVHTTRYTFNAQASEQGSVSLTFPLVRIKLKGFNITKVHGIIMHQKSISIEHDND